MTTVTKTQSSNSILLVVVILVMAVATAVVIAPSYNDVKLRSHAVERHGMDAVIARLATRNCTSLKAYRCPGSEKHPPSFFLICQESTGVMCTVMIVGTEGVELTSLRVPCSRSSELISGCRRAAVQ